MSPSRATYRDVKWRRDDDGTITWFNDGIDRWVLWYRGADAPPLPPRWAADQPSAPPPPRVVRPRWRSPYRVVPIVLAVAVIVVGVLQAVRSTSDPVRSETAKAEALRGHCLERTASGGRASYRAAAVPCELPVAVVRVVDVLPGTPGAPHCPAGTSPVQIAYLGVRYPHVECVTPVTHH